MSEGMSMKEKMKNAIDKPKKIFGTIALIAYATWGGMEMQQTLTELASSMPPRQIEEYNTGIEYVLGVPFRNAAYFYDTNIAQYVEDR